MRPIPSRRDRNWPDAARICRIERRRKLKDRCMRQVVYAITSLSAERADAEALLKLAGTTGRSEAPAALAHIRNAALNIIRRRGQKPTRP